MLCFVIPTLFIIVILGNMLGNALETLGTPWEFKRTLIKKHHGNLLGTWWKHFENIKIKKIQNHLKIKFETIPKNKPKLAPT